MANFYVLVFCVLSALAGDGEKTAPPPRRSLDPSFVAWVDGAGKKPISYRELARQFVASAGRDAKGYEAGMAGLESRFRAYLKVARQEPAETQLPDAELLRHFFFSQERFSANLDLTQVSNLFPDSILQRRQGYCLGLSILLLDLCERVQIPLALVSAPRHTFVRVVGPPAANLETTLQGEMHGDAWYIRRFALGAADSKHLLRTLTPREAAAHLVNNHGFALLESGHFADARRDFLAALKLSPDLVEGAINLGVLLARQGKFEGALKHFQQARRGWPQDPYVRLNQVNALTHLARLQQAAALATALYRSHPSLTGLAKTVHDLRAQLHPVDDWEALQSLTLAINEHRVDEGAKRPGLRGVYYGDTRLSREVKRRVDKNLSFQWNWNAPAPGVPRDNFSIRWDGFLDIPADDEYTFFITCSDGIRIWVDGRQVLDAWTRTRENFSQGTIALKEGLHDFRVEYFESNGEAGIAVILTAAKQKKALPLPPRLFHLGTKKR